MGTQIIKRKIIGETECKCHRCNKEASYALDISDTLGNIMSIYYCDMCIANMGIDI